MTNNLVFTVGNELMGDDGAGPLLADIMRRAPLQDWDVLDGGSVPENNVFKIREMAPEELLIVDAAEMALEPGDIRIIDQEQILGGFLMTTHALPLTYVIESIREFVPRVHMLGIQPGIVAFGYPMSPPVREAVAQVYQWLTVGGPLPFEIAAGNDEPLPAAWPP